MRTSAATRRRPELGRMLGERCITAMSSDHLALLEWAERFGCMRLWAVEDCRHLSRRLERDLLGAGETVVTRRVARSEAAHWLEKYAQPPGGHDSNEVRDP